MNDKVTMGHAGWSPDYKSAKSTNPKRFNSVEELVTETADTKEQVAEFLQRKLRAVESFFLAARKEKDKALKDLEDIRNAVRHLRDVKGRHNTQIAMERLIAILPENQPTP